MGVSKQFLKYLAVGLVNTLVGYGVFLILIRFFHVVPEAANTLGYLLALVVAFLLNKGYVFKANVEVHQAIPKFLLAFTLAFAMNQCVLFCFYRFLGVAAEIAQLPAMLTYTVVFYLLNKHFVFSKSAEE